MTKEAIDVGKARQDTEPEIRVLSTGVRARMTPVGASLIDDVVAQVPTPKVPTFFDEKKGRDQENPNDPEYLEALGESARKRTHAAMDAMLLFGLELVDPLPDDTKWISKLRWMAKRGILNLDDYDLEDEFELEFLFKRYIACGTADLILLGTMAGLNQASIDKAAESFKS